jgi:hypothetical protein
MSLVLLHVLVNTYTPWQEPYYIMLHVLKYKVDAKRQSWRNQAF